MKKNSGLIISFILILFPIYLWTLRMPIANRFFDFNSIITSLGQISGLLGMAMFIVVIVLSSRLKFLEKYFGGLNKMYFWHHMLGGLSLIFLLFHPIILVLKFIKISLLDAAMFLLPSGATAISFGIIALFGMILLLVLTFFIKLPYQFWKITHKFLAAIFFFAILHTFFIPSDVSMFLPLGLYMGFLVFLAALILLYRTILPGMVVKKFFYSVTAVNKLNDRVVEITMSAKNEKVQFVAGQYVFISFRGEGISKEIHPFSISSGENEEKLKITVKALGKYTADLQNLKAGSEAVIEGPFGVFSYLNTKNKNQVWIAGGVGITPFLSMAKSLKNNGHKIDLYYCANTHSEIVSLEELLKISEQDNGFKVVPFCADVEGRINVENIKNFSENILEKDFFLCGPPAMMKGLRSELLANGVSNRNIHSEEFSY